MTQTELPRLRPHARQGPAYRRELAAILAEIGPQLKADAEAVRFTAGKITPADLCRLALKYTLNVKATTKALEGMGILATGTYDAMRQRGFAPMAALREIHDMQVNDILIVFRALRAAVTEITEEEEDGYGACRYCQAESQPMYADGRPDEEADDYRISHETWCPSSIIDRAYAGLDEALVDRVLREVAGMGVVRDE